MCCLCAPYIRLCLVLYALSVCVHAGAEERLSEYQLKAVFLYNFSRFVTWPENAFEESGGAFHLCVVGDNPFEDILRKVLKSNAAAKRRVELFELEKFEQEQVCHILYISTSEEARLAEILAQVENKPVLTISDTDAFMEQGGMIKLYIKEKKIRFSLNLRRMKAVDLRPDANLLRVADLYEDGADKQDFE